MVEPAIQLPPGVAIAIIAFLLSLLPAGLFIWLWYLRRLDRPVPPLAVLLAFVLGMALVWPAFQIEELAPEVWLLLSPATAHYFSGAVVPLQSLADLWWPAVGAFLVVAVVEEGLRYLALFAWVRYSRAIDQVFDGLVVGLAAGLGFATVENTLYFLDLFRAGNFDTLVFVFFLRFLISTLAHLSFGGIMGVLLAQATFSIYRPRLMYLNAFLIPWFLHGVYDLLLGINLAAYAVLVLVPALLVLVVWAGRREFFVVNRENGRLIVAQRPPPATRAPALPRVLARFESPWNLYAPWLKERRATRELFNTSRRA